MSVKQHRREHTVRLWMVTRPSKEFFQLSDQGFCISHVGHVVHARELDEPCARKALIRQRGLQYSSGGWTKSPSTKIAEPRRLAVPCTNPNCSFGTRLSGCGRSLIRRGRNLLESGLRWRTSEQQDA